MEISTDKFSRMSPYQEFEHKERKVRRRVFHLVFAIVVLISGGFLIWKLSGLVVPVIVGALLAFYSAPLKTDLRSRGYPMSFKYCVPLLQLVSFYSSPSTLLASIVQTTTSSSNTRYG